MGNKWRVVVNVDPYVPIIFKTTTDFSKMSQMIRTGSNQLGICIRGAVTISNTLTWLASHTILVSARPFHALEVSLKFRRDSNYVHKPLFASSSTKNGHTQHMNTLSRIPPMKYPICSYHDLKVARVMYLHLPPLMAS